MHPHAQQHYAEAFEVGLAARWQPIETAPKDGTSILGRWFDSESGLPVLLSLYWRNGGWWDSGHGSAAETLYDHEVEDEELAQPVEWMPLTLPPLPQPPRQGHQYPELLKPLMPLRVDRFDKRHKLYKSY